MKPPHTICPDHALPRVRRFLGCRSQGIILIFLVLEYWICRCRRTRISVRERYYFEELLQSEEIQWNKQDHVVSRALRSQGNLVSENFHGGGKGSWIFILVKDFVGSIGRLRNVSST